MGESYEHNPTFRSITVRLVSSRPKSGSMFCRSPTVMGLTFLPSSSHPCHVTSSLRLPSAHSQPLSPPPRCTSLVSSSSSRCVSISAALSEDVQILLHPQMHRLSLDALLEPWRRQQPERHRVSSTCYPSTNLFSQIHLCSVSNKYSG